ncbi:MAG: AraC family transcriptional regulator [Oscillospiraceae bacterium]|nr:AraC family transcriptional regulator [Oscillospiraceae bacterium]
MREHGSILEHQELHMSNVLSFRKKMTQSVLQAEVTRVGQLVAESGHLPAGPTVTATYSVEQQVGGPVLDFEMLIPLDKPFTPPEGCVCKPVFKLTNAVSIRHIGNPAMLQETVSVLLAYLRQHAIQTVTPAYHVTVQDGISVDTPDQVIVDIYIGANPNIL